MNCSLENLHKSLKIRIFGYGSEQRTANSEQRTANSEQRTANIAYNKQPYLSIKKSPFWGNIFLRNGFFYVRKIKRTHFGVVGI